MFAIPKNYQLPFDKLWIGYINASFSQTPSSIFFSIYFVPIYCVVYWKVCAGFPQPFSTSDDFAADSLVAYNAPRAVTVIMQAHKHTFVTKSGSFIYFFVHFVYMTHRSLIRFMSQTLLTLYCTARFQKLNYTHLTF